MILQNIFKNNFFYLKTFTTFDKNIKDMTTSNTFNALVKLYDIAVSNDDADFIERINTIMTERYNQPIYNVYFWCDDFKNEVYSGYDKELATKEFYNVDRAKGKQHRLHDVYFDEVINDDYNTINNRTIQPINDESFQLMFDVLKELGLEKYNAFRDDENNTTPLYLRIADHSANCYNNWQEGNHVSIVISNENPTSHFQQSDKGVADEFYFTSNTSINEICQFIKNLISKYGY